MMNRVPGNPQQPMPQSGLGVDLRSIANNIHKAEQIVEQIRTRIHGPVPTAVDQEGVGPEPPLAGVVADIGNASQRLLNDLGSILESLG